MCTLISVVKCKVVPFLRKHCNSAPAKFCSKIGGYLELF